MKALAMTKTKAEIKMAVMVFSIERFSFPCFFFFVMGSLFLWFFCSPVFCSLFFIRSLPCLFSVSPLLPLFSCLQSFVFIGDMPGLLFAHGLPLDKHGWEGCVGVSLGFEYLSSIFISPGHLSS